jgi:catalase
MNSGDRKGEVNYEPSTLGEILQDPRDKYVRTPLTGTTQQSAISKTFNFRQAGEYYRTLSVQDKQDLVTALSGDLKRMTNDANKYTMLSYFYKADTDYGTRLAQATHADLSRVRSLADKLTEN